MNHYKYLSNQTHLSICNTCKKEFNHLYEENVKMHVSNTYILNELVNKSLKSNVQQLQMENDIIRTSLDFSKNLCYRNVYKLIKSFLLVEFHIYIQTTTILMSLSHNQFVYFLDHLFYSHKYMHILVFPSLRKIYS